MARRRRLLWAALLLWLIGIVGVFPAPLPACCLPAVSAPTAPLRMSCCLPPAGLSAVPACCRMLPRAVLAPMNFSSVAVPAFALLPLPAAPTVSTPPRLAYSRLPQARAVWAEPPSGGRGPRGPPVFS